MSDFQHGPGWWLASDGKWYPPEAAQAVPAPPAPPVAAPASWPPPGPPPAGPPPYSPPPGPAAASPSTTKRRRGPYVVLAVVAVAVVIAALAVVGHKSKPATAIKSPTTGAPPVTTASSSAAAAPPNPPTSPKVVSATTPLTSQSGHTVFTDEFTDPGSGWATRSSLPSTSLAYTPSGYTVTGQASVVHFVRAPYTVAIGQVAAVVSAEESSGAPPFAGIGVACFRGSGTSLLYYGFRVDTNRRWIIDRGVGPVSTSTSGSILKEGTSSASPGPTPMSVVGMCATLGDHQTTRLVLFINGSEIEDMTDVAPQSSNTGWTTTLLVATSSVATSTVTVTHFEVRNLAL